MTEPCTKTEKDIFLGDFIKAILKINTIAQETEKIADLFNNLELKSKLQQCKFSYIPSSLIPLSAATL